MNCRKCGEKAKRRRAGEFYCSRHGDLPAPKAAKLPEMFGPWPDIGKLRPDMIRAKGATDKGTTA